MFQALGVALNRWEYIEYGLSVMYSLFAGELTAQNLRDYGAGTIFSQRLDRLEARASAWFVRNCDQHAEGEFDRLATAARGFAGRRNEFAHGLVMNVTNTIFWRLQLRLGTGDKEQHLVIPPLHVWRKFDDGGMPVFGYSSYELNIISRRLMALEHEIDLFLSHHWPEDWKAPQ